MVHEQDILDYAAHMHCEELHMVTDEKTGLKAVVAIHNTKLGFALGGCRWIEYKSTLEATIDAIRLAQGMTYKSAIAGLPLGGGKAVLLKSKAPVDRKAYFAAFGRFLETLNGRYVTAVDSGTCIEDMDIIATQTNNVTSTSNSIYSSPDPSSLTALGVYEGIKAGVKFKFGKDSLSGVHIAVQGVGHVGYHLVKLIWQDGAKITVSDSNHILVERCVNEFKVDVVADIDNIYSVDCDVFSPCALGAVLNKKSIPMINAQIIAGAANNQLGATEDAEMIADRGILYAPDFVINAGAIIYVAGQYSKISEEDSQTKIVAIAKTLQEIFECSVRERKNTHRVAYAIAFERIYGKVYD